MIRRSALTTALVIATALVLSAVAFAATQNLSQTAQSGNVKATFSFTAKTVKNTLPTYSNERLTIVRDGHTYSNPLRNASCPGCWPSDPRRNGHSVQVVDINHAGEPNVIVTLYSGGAHCCTIAEVFTYSAGTGAYVEVDHNFADRPTSSSSSGPPAPTGSSLADDVRVRVDRLRVLGRADRQDPAFENGAFERR